MHVDPHEPRSLRNPAAREQRRSLLREPHIVPLTDLVVDLRSRLPGGVPDFDPLDGGVDAFILFLFEKPGPMTEGTRSGRSGSGFISRDNDDPSAEATFHFMKTAGLPRSATLIWNVIPWWDGRVTFTNEDRSAGLRELDALLRLLPRLDTVVLVGKTAARARPFLRNVRVIESPHPSPKVRATNRAAWESIPNIWRVAGSLP